MFLIDRDPSRMHHHEPHHQVRPAWKRTPESATTSIPTCKYSAPSSIYKCRSANICSCVAVFRSLHAPMLILSLAHCISGTAHPTCQQLTSEYPLDTNIQTVRTTSLLWATGPGPLTGFGAMGKQSYGHDH